MSRTPVLILAATIIGIGSVLPASAQEPPKADDAPTAQTPFNDGFPYLSQPYSGFSRSGGTATSPTGQP